MRPIQPSAFQYLLPQLVQSGPNTQTAGESGWTPGGGFSLQVPDNTIIGGAPRGICAVDLQPQRVTAAQVASGAGSFVAGTNNRASGISSVAIGSSTSATGNYAVAIGQNTTASSLNATATGFNCTASGNYATAMGYYASAGATASFSVGNFPSASGYGSAALGTGTASGTYSASLGASYPSSTYTTAFGNSSSSNTFAIAGGSSNASGQYSTALGQASATATYSTAFGYSRSAQQGKLTISGGVFSTQGDSQFGVIVLRGTSTSSSQVILTTDALSLSTTNTLIVSTNQAMVFTGTLIGKQTGSSNIAAYSITGTIVNNAGTVSIPSLSAPLIIDTIGLTFGPSYAIDSTNKGIAIISGAKSFVNIRWVCTLFSTEVVYA